MMKYAILLTALFVSTLANPLFPFLGGHNRYPNNMDQDDGVQQGTGAQQQGDGNADDGDEMGGPGVAPQAGTVMPPPAGGGDSSSSSSSSSEEDVGSEAGAAGGGATLAPAGPIVGQDPNAPQTGADAAGDNSDGDVNINQVEGGVAGPMIADPGNTSGQQDPAANPLNLAPQAMKQQQSRRSSFAIAVTTMILVAGVAATAAVTYKYKGAIIARIY